MPSSRLTIKQQEEVGLKVARFLDAWLPKNDRTPELSILQMVIPPVVLQSIKEVMRATTRRD